MRFEPLLPPLPKNYRLPRWTRASNTTTFHLVLGDDTLACSPTSGTGATIPPSGEDIASICPDCYHCLKKMEEAIR